MAKIDVSKITNYTSMTPDEKIVALEAYDIEESGGTELEKYKAAVSKANSEAAEWKRKHNALLSDEERKTAESAESLKKLEDELAALRKDKSISESKAKFLSLGYDEKLASETATALASGDMEKVFANQALHLENVKKTATASALAGEPKPPAGSGGKPVDYSAQIADAQANSDYATAAYLMRQQQEALMNKT